MNTIATVFYFLVIVSQSCMLFLTLDLSKANVKTILMQLLTGLSKDVNTETYSLHKRLKVAATVFYFLSVASNSCKLNIAFDSSKP
jgi:hypothetical protein